MNEELTEISNFSLASSQVWGSDGVLHFAAGLLFM
jgi:hypothetical protein